jgi:hypothetical protein
MVHEGGQPLVMYKDSTKGLVCLWGQPLKPRDAFATKNNNLAKTDARLALASMKVRCPRPFGT